MDREIGGGRVEVGLAKPLTGLDGTAPELEGGLLDGVKARASGLEGLLLRGLGVFKVGRRPPGGVGMDREGRPAFVGLAGAGLYRPN